MAHGAILGQMPQIDGIPAVIETYPIATGNTITAGDVVDVVDGQIQRTLTPQANVETVFNSSSTTGIGTANLSNGIFVASYLDASSISVKAGAIKGNDLVFGSEKGVYISTTALSSPVCCGLNGTDFITGYIFGGEAYSKYGTVSSSDYSVTLTPSSAASLGTKISSGSTTSLILVTLSENSFVAIYNRSGLKAKVCTISGTTITPLTEYSLSGNTSSGGISATRLLDSGTTRRVCVCYSDDSDSDKGKAVIVSIDSSNKVTWGTPYVFNNRQSGKTSCCFNGKDIYAVTVCGGSESPWNVGFFDFSETVISNFTSISIGKINGNPSLSPISDGVVFARGDYLTPTTYSNATVILKSGDGTLSHGSNFSFKTGSPISISSVNIEDKIVLTYVDNGNSNRGTSTIISAYGNQVAGSFLDGSKDAIALQSGTSGQSIEVIYSGTVYADWVTAGQVINSPGVYGVGVLDKVLQVWSKDRPGQVEVGSYTGNGQYGSGSPTVITANFNIKFAVFDYTASSGQKRYALFSKAGGTSGEIIVNSNSSCMGEIILYTISGNQISFYGGSAYSQMNDSGCNTTYTIWGE